MIARLGVLWLRFRARVREWRHKLRERLTGRLAMEAATEGRTALYAVAQDTPEGDIQIAIQRDAWTTQIDRLSTIDNRNRDQEYLLRQLRRNVRELDVAESLRHATPQSLGGVRMGLLGPVAAVSWFRPWMILAAGWALTAAFCAVQMGLKERVEDQRDEARADLAQTERALVAARETQARLADAVREADTQTRQTAETIEQERARRLRAEREARRIRDAQAQAAAGGPVDYGFGGVRDAGGAAPGPGDDRPAGGDPG